MFKMGARNLSSISWILCLILSLVVLLGGIGASADELRDLSEVAEEDALQPVLLRIHPFRKIQELLSQKEAVYFIYGKIASRKTYETLESMGLELSYCKLTPLNDQTVRFEEPLEITSSLEFASDIHVERSFFLSQV